VSKLNAHHNENNDLAFALEMERVTGVMRWIQHFMALIIKRFRYTTRDFFGVACEILLPIFCVFVGLVLKSISVWTRDQSPISFEPSEFLKPEINGLPTFFPSKIEFYSHD
jgi:cell division protein FtsW (lipid II flippase)